MVGFLRPVTPARLGEPALGEDGYDPDLHCQKFYFISDEMQKEEEIAEKKLNKQFVEEPIKDPEWRAMFLIPKTNLRIPVNWFDYASDAAAFIRAAAKCNDVGVYSLGKAATGTTLCIFMDVAWKHRHLRVKKEEDPPCMSLQERRTRYWKAIIHESSLARDFTLRLVRHVTFMLVGASFDFAKSNGQRSSSSTLSGKVERLRDWFEENDPADLEAFECLQPERRKLHRPYANSMCYLSPTVTIPMRLANRAASLVGPQPQRRSWAPCEKKGKGKCDSRKRKIDTYRPSPDCKRRVDTYRPSSDSRREVDTYRPPDSERKADTYRPSSGCKRKADTYHPSSDLRSKRQIQTRSPPPPRAGDTIELPRRFAEGKRGKRDWGERA